MGEQFGQNKEAHKMHLNAWLASLDRVGPQFSTLPRRWMLFRLLSFAESARALRLVPRRERLRHGGAPSCARRAQRPRR